MKQIQALPGAPGQALLPAAVFYPARPKPPPPSSFAPKAEVDRFEQVRAEYILHLRSLCTESRERLGENAAQIFEAYESIAADDFFFHGVLALAQKEQLSVSDAMEREKQRVALQFSQMDNPYLRERSHDIQNVCEELLHRLHGGQPDILALPNEPFILVAENLAPESIVQIDKQHLGGFATEKGGATSHVVILAKALGIPAVVGAAGLMDSVQNGQPLYVNGGQGFCVVAPDDAFIGNFLREEKALVQQRLEELQAARLPAQTADGHPVRVCVNSGDADSIAKFDASTCDGVGLFRTEFLFMESPDFPDEETQFAAYLQMAEKTDGKELVVRTLDVGADKPLPYMNLPCEPNPSLGHRGIRLCLDYHEMFSTQLRAILRASTHGNISIMFPFVVSLDELLQAKALLQKAKNSLSRDGIAHGEIHAVGVMIETPAAVLMADVLAKHVDFFSIGTNDLIQYITAADRQNETVHALCSPFEPAVLRAIWQTIFAAHSAGIRVGICGEMASHPALLPLLLGMGLNELSVAPPQVARLKKQISGLRMPALQELAQRVLELHTAAEVQEHMKSI